MTSISLDAAKDMIGKESGVSEWITVEQDRINQFADVTEDHQFIHINPDMAKMTPFGGTIAHGFLTLSLLAKMGEEASIVLDGVKMGVNYGFDKVRFLAPVPTGSKVRGRFVVAAVEEKRPGQILITYDVTVEIDGEEKPALIAKWMGMQFTG
ncbi:acyl dehydratase [Litorimonas taeanensis]|uniref:Acyl dehydratase n=1 Tax=Litorimonas taeanensis TaxID=568099 RepID=A0A420WLW0_9PROT|nr:MaoC family dehydratase [Litorimonas taeanensis]RKQ72014.1 acyl dehydratase [Litorimonas taeanensis]